MLFELAKSRRTPEMTSPKSANSVLKWEWPAKRVHLGKLERRIGLMPRRFGLAWPTICLASALTLGMCLCTAKQRELLDRHVLLG